MGQNAATKTYVASRNISGSYVGNGTEHSVNLGFRPKRVKIYSDDNKFAIRKFDGQGETKGMGRMKSGGGLAMRSLELTSGGIAITNSGFTVGNNNAVNENGVTYYWEAMA